ncbi:MAG: hypothetical protein KFB93_03850 [Simkaniaceae bacterium]|jgi:riboflavin kinase/FMN adenylyltransferase|nr:MAG: hypothetical protein KFB93_03850 [Simkaniaceae bacterium]
MKVVNSILEIPPLEGPVSLTIGVYDGLHLGHQAILKRLHKETKKEGSRVLLTFSNHPSTYLRPNSPAPLLMTFNHRLKLLEEHSIDLVIALPFDSTFAKQTYEEFFNSLCQRLPIKHLIVGDDARFGKERKGGPDEIKALDLFTTTYLPKETYHKEPISSGAIRSYLEKGDLKKVKKMLGRPYSLRLPFDEANVIREDEVQYKWVTGAEKVCLLPPAVYAVDLQTEGKKIPAIAFYRGTHSINNETELSLTLIFEKEIPPSDEIEITFVSYLHDELDSEMVAPSRTNLLETLKPEFFPS